MTPGTRQSGAETFTIKAKEHEERLDAMHQVDTATMGQDIIQ
jgi:hypothetical protein